MDLVGAFPPLLDHMINCVRDLRPDLFASHLLVARTQYSVVVVKAVSDGSGPHMKKGTMVYETHASSPQRTKGLKSSCLRSCLISPSRL